MNKSILTIYPIYLDNVAIATVNEQKHLGVATDNKLKRSAHTDHMISSVSKMIDVLQKSHP